MGYGVEALPSSTVGGSAAETRPTARFRNGRTPAKFMPKGCLMGLRPKGCLMGLRTGGLSAPSNQPSSTVGPRRFGCRNTSYGTDPKRQNPSKIHAPGAPNGFEDRGPCSTFEPAKSKELERDGWMGYGVEALPSSTV